MDSHIPILLKRPLLLDSNSSASSTARHLKKGKRSGPSDHPGRPVSTSERCEKIIQDCSRRLKETKSPQKQKTLLLSRSKAYQDIQQHNDALRDAKAAIRLDPQDASGYIIAASAFFAADYNVNGLNSLRMALQKLPSSSSSSPSQTVLDKVYLDLLTSLIGRHILGDPLATLPFEIVRHILQFLDHRSILRASRVSRSWRTAIVFSPNLWQTLDLVPLPKKAYPLFSLSHLANILDRYVKRSKRCLTFVSTCSHYDFDENALNLLSQTASTLETLILTNQTNQHWLNQIISKGSCLKHLSITHHHPVRIWNQLDDHLPSQMCLKRFHFVGHSLVIGPKLVQSLNQVESLRIEFKHNSPPPPSSQAQGLIQILTAARHTIQELVLADQASCGLISSATTEWDAFAGISTFQCEFIHLRTLIGWFPPIGRSIQLECPQLEEACLSFSNPEEERWFFTTSSSIKKLTLIKRIQSDYLHGTYIHLLSQLEDLEIRTCNTTESRQVLLEALTPSTSNLVTVACPKLKSLTIQSGYGLGDSDLVKMVLIRYHLSKGMNVEEAIQNSMVSNSIRSTTTMHSPFTRQSVSGSNFSRQTASSSSSSSLILEIKPSSSPTPLCVALESIQLFRCENISRDAIHFIQKLVPTVVVKRDVEIR